MSLHTPPSESTSLTTLFSLANKRCLITGGNRGIGLAISQAFAEAGASHIAIVHSSTANSPKANEIVQDLLDTYPNTLKCAKTYIADVSIASQIENVTTQLEKDFGGLDICVVNAGVYCDGPLLDSQIPVDGREEQATTVGKINWEGALFTARAAARIMKAAGTGGKIIFTASINAHMVLRPQREAIYCATKAAVLHLSRALAVEWAEYNIQVNSVSPGYVDTAMNDILIANNPGQVEVWLRDCPAKRFCKVWELKGVYVFLASAASSYVTGADFVIDGGHTCH